MSEEIMAKCLEGAVRVVEGLRSRSDIDPKFLEVMDVVTIAAAMYRERMRVLPINTLPGTIQPSGEYSSWGKR